MRTNFLVYEPPAALIYTIWTSAQISRRFSGQSEHLETCRDSSRPSYR